MRPQITQSAPIYDICGQKKASGRRLQCCKHALCRTGLGAPNLRKRGTRRTFNNVPQTRTSVETRGYRRSSRLQGLLLAEGFWQGVDDVGRGHADPAQLFRGEVTG